MRNTVHRGNKHNFSVLSELPDAFLSKITKFCFCTESVDKETSKQLLCAVTTEGSAVEVAVGEYNLAKHHFRQIWRIHIVLANKKVVEIIFAFPNFIARTEEGALWTWKSSKWTKPNIQWMQDNLDEPELLMAKDIVSVKANTVNCVVALSRQGEVFQWQHNCVEGLGEHAQVKFGEHVITQVECSGHSSFAVSKEGKAFCWRNADKRPRMFKSESKFLDIACGHSSVTLLTTDHQVYTYDFQRLTRLDTEVSFEKIICVVYIDDEGTTSHAHNAQQQSNNIVQLFVGFSTTATDQLYVWGKSKKEGEITVPKATTGNNLADTLAEHTQVTRLRTNLMFDWDRQHLHHQQQQQHRTTPREEHAS